MKQGNLKDTQKAGQGGWGEAKMLLDFELSFII